MGQAFHRKRISIERGRTRGVGIRYVDVVPPVVHELTPEQVAMREAEAQQQATLLEQRRKGVDILVEIAGEMLHAWKDATDYNDQRLIDFAGWATSNFCALPVEKDVARYYAERIQWYKRQADQPLSLDELDEIIKVSCQRNASTEQIVEEATKTIRYAARECVDSDRIDVTGFIEILVKRVRRATQKNTGLDEALAFVSNQMASMFQQFEAAVAR